MLYNLTIIVLSLAIPVGAFLSFRAGYKAGRAVGRGVEMPEITPHIRDKPDPMTEEQRRVNTILSNIDAYDGTNDGQVRL